MTKPWLVSAILLIALPANASDLEKKIKELAASHHGDVALYAKNLTTGETVSLDSARPVRTASVIKLPLMLQVFEQVKLRKLKLSAPVLLTKDNQVPGSGILKPDRSRAHVEPERRDHAKDDAERQYRDQYGNRRRWSPDHQ